MEVQKTQLIVSKSVAQQTEECEFYVPPGEFFIDIFTGEAAFNPNVAVKLIWDLGGAGETVIWTIKGSATMPFQYSNTGDGVKKIAVCLDNSLSTGSVFISGYAEIKELI